MSAEPDNIAAVESGPTDAELDRLEALYTQTTEYTENRQLILRLIKALRACRRRSEAKDAAVEALRSLAGYPIPGLPWPVRVKFDRARAELDKETTIRSNNERGMTDADTKD